MPDNRILIVGTTSDYIDHIRRLHPGRAVFVTDPAIRLQSRDQSPKPEEEAVISLDDEKGVIAALKSHMHRYFTAINGLVCFDCESLPLASTIAESLSLRFPSRDTINALRNKWQSKRIWHRAGVACPKADLIRNEEQLSVILSGYDFPVILKPVTGSGSELVFKCNNMEAAVFAFHTIRRHLTKNANPRMYVPMKFNGTTVDGASDILVEEFIRGEEYSCDVLIDGDRIDILRMTWKIPAPGQPTGTVLAYIVGQNDFSPEQQEGLKEQIRRAAAAVELTRAVCMIDFIVSRDGPCFLEMTPRFGGDCLPWLIYESCGLDIFNAAMDFSMGKSIARPCPSKWKSLVGMRILASAPGVITAIDPGSLAQDPNVKDVRLKAYPGYRVEFPPKDYDSRILGHVIFVPDPGQSILCQCAAMRKKITVETE